LTTGADSQLQTRTTLQEMDAGLSVEKSQREENRMLYEHQKEIQELRTEIREKDSLLDDLTQNSDVQMQVSHC